MTKAQDKEKARLKQAQRHAPINQRLRGAKNRGITVNAGSNDSPATKFFNKWIREQLGIPTKAESDE